MKKILILPLLLGLGAVLLLKAEPRYERYTPLFMERAELERSVSYDDTPRPMVDPGKIHVHGTRLLIVEKYRGIHVVDNSDPGHPDFRAFIVAPGCLDLAMKDNILYLDNAVDLVAFDLDARQLTERMRDFFPEHTSPDGRFPGYWDRPEGLILVGWRDNNPQN